MGAPPQGLPSLRRRDLLTRAIGNELVVYDLERHRAFCLGDVARIVWDGCAVGSRRAEVEQAVGLLAGAGEPDAAEALVDLALERLRRAGLLVEEAPVGPGRRAGPRADRREVLRTLGLAAAWLPLVVSITTPTAAQSGSCLVDVEQGKPCLPSQCGQECGGTTFCGSGQRQCRRVGGGNYRCVPPAAGSCP